MKGLFIGPAQVHGYHAADLSPGPQAKLAAGSVARKGRPGKGSHGGLPTIGVSPEEERRRNLVEERDRQARLMADEVAKELLDEEEKAKESSDPLRGQQQEASSKKRKAVKVKKRKGDAVTSADLAREVDDTAHNDGDDTAATALPESSSSSKVELRLSVGATSSKDGNLRVQARTSATPADDAEEDTRSKEVPNELVKGAPSGAGVVEDDDWEVVTKGKRKGKKNSQDSDEPAVPSTAPENARSAGGSSRRANDGAAGQRSAGPSRSKGSRPAAPLQEALDRPAASSSDGSPATVSESDTKSEAGSSSASSATGTGTASDNTAVCAGAGPAQHAFSMWADATIQSCGRGTGVASRPSSTRMSPTLAIEAAGTEADGAVASAAAQGEVPPVVVPVVREWPALKSGQSTSSKQPVDAAGAADEGKAVAKNAPSTVAATVASAVSAAASAVSAVSTAAAAAAAASALSPATESAQRPQSRSWASLVKKEPRPERKEDEAKGPVVAKGYTLLSGAASVVSAGATSTSGSADNGHTSKAATVPAAAKGNPSIAPDVDAPTTPTKVNIAVRVSAGTTVAHQACGCQADMPHSCSLSTQTSPPPSPADSTHRRPASSLAGTPAKDEAAHGALNAGAPEARRRESSQPTSKSAPPTPSAPKPKPPAWSSAAPRPKALMIPGSVGNVPPGAADKQPSQAAGGTTSEARVKLPPSRDSPGEARSGAVSYSKAASTGTSRKGSPPSSPRNADEAAAMPAMAPSYSQATAGSAASEVSHLTVAPSSAAAAEQATGHTQRAAHKGSHDKSERQTAAASRHSRGSKEGIASGQADGQTAPASSHPSSRPGLIAPAGGPLPPLMIANLPAAAIPISPVQAAMDRLHSQIHSAPTVSCVTMVPMVPMGITVSRVPVAGVYPYVAPGVQPPHGPLLWAQAPPAGIFTGAPLPAFYGARAPPAEGLRAASAGVESSGGCDVAMSDDERAAFAFGQWAMNAEVSRGNSGGASDARRGRGGARGGGAGSAFSGPGANMMRMHLFQPAEAQAAGAPQGALQRDAANGGRGKGSRGKRSGEVPASPGNGRPASVGKRSSEPLSPAQTRTASVPSSPVGSQPPSQPLTPKRQVGTGGAIQAQHMLPPSQGPPGVSLSKAQKKALAQQLPGPGGQPRAAALDGAQRSTQRVVASLGTPPLSPGGTVVPAAPLPHPRLSKLHDEIFAFAQASILSGEAAHAEVMTILASLRGVVGARWHQASVELYGSRSTGLSLASSDVDVTLLGMPINGGRESIGAALKDLHSDLEKTSWVASQQLVLSARIPVLKVKSTTGVPVDITISDTAQHTGLLARDLVLGYLHEAPQLTPLVIVLKSFLREMGLNDPFTGGMSSYSLVVLLWMFICESVHRGYATTDLGYQLIGFFSMFLYRFESQLTHVDDPLSPMISGPGEVRENIMHSCYQIGRVCRTFHRALQVLSPEQPAWDDEETPLLPRLFTEVAGSSRATQTDPHQSSPLDTGSRSDVACNTPLTGAARVPSASSGGRPTSPRTAAVTSVVEKLTRDVEAAAMLHQPAARIFSHTVSPTAAAAAATAAALASPTRVPPSMTAVPARVAMPQTVPSQAPHTLPSNQASPSTTQQTCAEAAAIKQPTISVAPSSTAPPAVAGLPPRPISAPPLRISDERAQDAAAAHDPSEASRLNPASDRNQPPTHTASTAELTATDEANFASEIRSSAAEVHS